jgi:hypothetical protein
MNNNYKKCNMSFRVYKEFLGLLDIYLSNWKDIWTETIVSM